MFWCDRCKIWEHEACIVDDIRKQYIESPKVAAAAKNYSESIKIINKENGEVMAIVHDGGLGRLTDDVELGPVDENAAKVEMAVNCLKCRTQLA
jgi:hypothetical protein